MSQLQFGPSSKMTYNTWGGAARALPVPDIDHPSRLGEGISIGSRPMSVADKHAQFRDERFFPYFGLANKAIRPQEDYLGMPEQENFDLPDAYHGSNNLLRTIIITSVTKVQMWGTSIAFPWKQWENGQQIVWDTWEF